MSRKPKQQDEIVSHRLDGLSFGLLTADEIRKLSVKEITNPQSFDAMAHSTHGGLYDPALGNSVAFEAMCLMLSSCKHVNYRK